MYKSLKVHLCILTNQSTLHKATCSSCHYMQLECTNVTKDLYGKKLINGGNPLIQMTLKLRLILIQGEDCPQYKGNLHKPLAFSDESQRL